MDDKLVECQIPGCHEPAAYLIIYAKKWLYVCDECFCRLGRIIRGKGGDSYKKNWRR